MHLETLICDALNFAIFLCDYRELAFENLWIPQIVQNKNVIFGKWLIGDQVSIIALLLV